MFDKVKNWLGIEGAKISIINIEVDKDLQLLSGKVSLTTSSDQHIHSMIITVKEKYTRGRRKSKLSDVYTIGNTEILIDELITAEEPLEKEFEVAYQMKLSSVDSFGRKNLLNRALAKTAKAIKGVNSIYTCTVELSIEGNRLKPYDSTIVNI
jgi:hypothetical protein